jgi:hypothetical protein
MRAMIVITWVIAMLVTAVVVLWIITQLRIWRCEVRVELKRERGEIGTAKLALPMQLNSTIVLLAGKVAVDLGQEGPTAAWQEIIVANMFRRVA